MDFLSDSVEAIAGRVRSGEQSAREVVEHAIHRIEALDPVLNAFVAWDAEGALAQAHRVDEMVAAGRDPGLLAGVPVGVKDLEAVTGFVTSFGSAMHVEDPPATEDSVHVARLRAAGAVIMGKTNTPEFGHKGATDNVPFGQTVNPWSASHSPGGSSGGTAAAIAAGMVPLGTGSDGGGSIRIPASLCGLSGLKTETARVPITGRTMPGSGLLSTNGPMGRTTMDTAIALDAVVGPHPRDPLSLPHPGESWADRVRTRALPSVVVWSPTMGYAEVDEEILAACTAVVEDLERAGTTVINVEEIFPEDPVHEWLVLWAVARFKAQGHLLGTPDFDRLSETIQPQIELGAGITGEQFARAQDACYRLNWLLEDVLDQAPLVLTPTNAGRAPRLGEDGMINGEAAVGWVRFTYGINMTRHPAGTVCAGLTSEGTPIGLQIIGRHRSEGDVLAAMASLEDVVGFGGRPPLAG